MVHLLWEYGLKAWIAVCVAGMLVTGLLCWREVRRERRGDLS